MAMSLSSTFHGRVVAVNMRGLKLEGHDEWTNFSKFAPEIIPPLKGETVTIVVDRSGFIRSCETLDGPAPIRGGSDARIDAQGRSGRSEKDRTITRLAVLRSAVQLAQGRGDLSSADVLRVAEVFEAWVYREGNEDD